MPIFMYWIQILDNMNLFRGIWNLSVLDIGIGTVACETIDALQGGSGEQRDRL